MNGRAVEEALGGFALPTPRPTGIAADVDEAMQRIARGYTTPAGEAFGLRFAACLLIRLADALDGKA